MAHKLWIACNDKRISENFVWMMDDVYFLKPMQQIPYYKLATYKNYEENIVHKNSQYYKSMLHK